MFLPVSPYISRTILFVKDPARKVERNMARIYSATLSDPPRHAELFKASLERLQTRQPVAFTRGFLGHIRAVQTHFLDWRHLLHLRFSSFPILCIVGDVDKLVRIENTHVIHSVVGGEKMVMADAGHGLVNERPEMVNPAIESKQTKKQKKNAWCQMHAHKL